MLIESNNHSPWLAQISNSKIANVLSSSQNTDVCIVGAGISGIMTAYFTLKNTNLNVYILEGHRIAHGATGHNAGQIASYFERPFSSIVEEFGLDMAGEAQKNILHSWDLLEEIYKDLSLTTPKVDFIGYAGFSSIDEVNAHLHNNYLRIQAGISTPKSTLISNSIDKRLINPEYWPMIEFVNHSEINSILESNDKEYIAVFRSKKGLLNSAALTNEIAEKLTNKYSERLKIFEHSKVEKIVVNPNGAEATCWGFKVHCKKIVLCTNGFEKTKIVKDTGENLDHKLNLNLRRVIGYMKGYALKKSDNPIAISYFPKNSKSGLIDQNIYFYLTRRNFILNNLSTMLVCIGGPERALDLSNIYVRDHSYAEDFKKDINNFTKTLSMDLADVETKFNWFGLMGYTKSGLRIIGNDSSETSLMYNLGCNGVGILSAIYGGFKIGEILKGRKFSPSVFDYTE